MKPIITFGGKSCLKKLLFIIMVVFPSFCMATDVKQAINDSSDIVWNHFDKQLLQQYQQNENFHYDIHQSGFQSLTDRFFMWLSQYFQSLSSLPSYGGYLEYIIYFICILVIIYVILKLLNINIRSLFYKDQAEVHIPYSSYEEDIHAIDFNTSIAKAVEKKDFRLAIRLTYLMALNTMSSHEVIGWKAGKTNHEYLNEISIAPIKTDFSRLVYFFEYAWYGEFPVDESSYATVENLFLSIKKNIKSGNEK